MRCCSTSPFFVDSVPFSAEYRSFRSASSIACARKKKKKRNMLKNVFLNTILKTRIHVLAASASAPASSSRPRHIGRRGPTFFRRFHPGAQPGSRRYSPNLSGATRDGPASRRPEGLPLLSWRHTSASSRNGGAWRLASVRQRSRRTLPTNLAFGHTAGNSTLLLLL